MVYKSKSEAFLTTNTVVPLNEATFLLYASDLKSEILEGFISRKQFEKVNK